MHAVVRPHVRVGADVFAQHAGLLAADAAFLTDVFTSSTPTHVNILLVGFVSARLQQDTSAGGDNRTHLPKIAQLHPYPPSNILIRLGSALGATSLSSSFFWDS